MDRGAQRIVVGVDGSDGGRAALRWALEEAALRKATVDAVLAWHLTFLAGSPAVAVAFDPAEEAADAHRRLEQLVSEAVGSDHAGVEVSSIVAEGTAARVLLDVAKGADLLVLGSRGHGGFTGLLLGSVSQQCVHHAPCPVVVVRP